MQSLKTDYYLNSGILRIFLELGEYWEVAQYKELTGSRSVNRIHCTDQLLDIERRRRRVQEASGPIKAADTLHQFHNFDLHRISPNR